MRAADARDDPARSGACRVRPLTDAEHAQRVTVVRTRLADALAAGLATEFRRAVGVNGEGWPTERDDPYELIIDDLYASAPMVPCECRAVFAGGLPGAGKTTVLTRHAGIEASRFMTINPDTIKAQMAHRGLVPEVPELSPMEASYLVHEECSHIAKRLAHRAQADGRNVIWDITMSKTSSVVARIESLRSAGYSRIAGLFVDIPVEVSIRRADARHRQGHEQYRMGIGQGGRYVPRELILAQADADVGCKNRGSFEQLKHQFDTWARYDNSVDGRPPVIVEIRLQGDATTPWR